jgi:hypothetical protein
MADCRASASSRESVDKGVCSVVVESEVEEVIELLLRPRVDGMCSLNDLYGSFIGGIGCRRKPTRLGRGAEYVRSNLGGAGAS